MSIAETPALLKFLSNPNSYVSYVNPHLLSDGSNITQWIDSLDDLAHLLFGVKFFFGNEANFNMLEASMDWSVLHKNFHKSTWARQLELINSLIHLDNNLSPAHFNQFFAIMSQLSSLGVLIPSVAQGLFLQALTSPPAGTTHTQMNNLILAAAEKSDELGAWDIQVIYNLVQSDSVNGAGTEENLFKINRIGLPGKGMVASGRGGGLVGTGRGRFIIPNDLCHYCQQKGHWKFDCPYKMDTQVWSGWGRGSFNKPEASFAPAIRVAAADAHGIVDTGATNHVCGDISLFLEIKLLQQELLLKLASFDGTVAATHVGSIRISSTPSTIKLKNVLYFPKVHGTLLSPGHLLDEGFKVDLSDGVIFIKDVESGGVVTFRIPFLASSTPVSIPTYSAALKISHEW
ncbi:uncharacterized protein VP01_2911g1 [Puccinia sorghi]|uniref:Uncharacterized protein n=1 Tax=Puccinia sorghi TaxID=27349 RepID=A0A0L6V1A7_9BASI|nr:uncharacterized protein VP01_2911g1 [Puccinia sorghi]